MNSKALKEFLIAFVSIVILIILFSPIISRINLQNMNMKVDLKEGKILPTSLKYRESPFVFDHVGSKPFSFTIYDSTGIDITGSADISSRLILDKDSRIVVSSKLKNSENQLRIWLYSSDGKLISSGKNYAKGDLQTWEFDISNPDLYKLRANFNYQDVLNINAEVFVKTKKKRSKCLRNILIEM